MSAQDETLDRYHALMHINAEAQVFRVAREVGILDQLRGGQATAADLIERLQLQPRLAHSLLEALVAMKVLERYEEDYALAAVTRLLCEYDQDLGDQHWQNLIGRLKTSEEPAEAAENPSDESAQPYFDAVTATQWIHTGAAKQAAELLDIGGERQGKHILDLGCGSAVWSAAMAFADPTARVTAVDLPPRMTAAQRTVASIAVTERYEMLAADPQTVELPADSYDIILLAGRLSGHHPGADDRVFQRLHTALREGGELVIIDLFQGPGEVRLNEAIEALRLASMTKSGKIRDAEQMRLTLLATGYKHCQFAFLAASRQGYGLLLARKNL